MKFRRSNAFTMVELLVAIGVLAIMSVGIYTFSTRSQKTVAKGAHLLNFMQNFSRLLMYYEKDSMSAILPSDLPSHLSTFQTGYKPEELEVKVDGAKGKVNYLYDKDKGSLLRTDSKGKRITIFDSGLGDLQMKPFMLYYKKPGQPPGYRPGVFIEATYIENNNVSKTMRRIIFFKYNKDVQDCYNSWKY